MDDESLKKFSDAYYEIPDKSWELFAEFLKPCSFKKNGIIKSPHKKESQLYLITKGSSGHFKNM